MVSTNLRFADQEALYEAIKKSARNNHRSLNGEILRAIEYYLTNAPEAHYEAKPVEKEVPKKRSKSP